MTAAAVRRLAASLTALTGCAHAGVPQSVRALEADNGLRVATTDRGNASLIAVARTAAGVIVVDLGWRGADAALRSALTRVDARPADVTAVLLTHSHRDHVGAWPAVAGARLFVGMGEAARLTGADAHRGWIPRLADRMQAPRLPDATTLRVTEVGGDSTLVFGRDTVRAFALPGHTVGSMAWLVRGVLFVGDGASHDKRTGRLRPARRGFSDDASRAHRSLARLEQAVAPYRVRLVCTAHARCAPPTAALWARLTPRD